jgi:hypothetical protein
MGCEPLHLAAIMASASLEGQCNGQYGFEWPPQEAWLDAIHFGHHDVHENQIGVGVWTKTSASACALECQWV